MRLLTTAFVCSLAATAAGTAAADSLKLTRNALSGVDSLLAYERAWDKDCKALPSVVTVTEQPKNGSVSVVQTTGTIPASTRDTGSTGGCAGTAVTGNQIRYTSNPGYHGRDTVSYTIMTNNAPAGSKVITIIVK